MVLLVQNFLEENPFNAFKDLSKRKKKKKTVSMTAKLEGGRVKALVVGQLKKITFYAASLLIIMIKCL